MDVTIDDIAREANVSIATVSRVINQSQAVSPELRRRVLEAIERNHYKPNTFARGLATNKSNMIGIIVTDISNPVISVVIKGINSVCQQRGYTVMVCESGGVKENEWMLLQRMEEQRVSGVLLAGLNVDGELTKKMLELDYPIVLVTQESSDGKNTINTVIHDNVSAIMDAVKFLTAIGHRRIAFIGGPEEDYSSGMKRLEGFRKAAELAGLTIPDTYIWHGNFTYDSGHSCMRRIYEENAEIPTAILACSDLMAVGAASCAVSMGLRIPEDISIMGFDDSELAMYFQPPLSTVRIPYFEEGKRAVEELLELIEVEKKTTGKLVYVPHKIIRRFSVKDIR